MVIPDVPGGGEDRGLGGADAVREVDRDAGFQNGGTEMAEREREVRDRHAGLDVPHRGAEEDLHVDQEVVVSATATRRGSRTGSRTSSSGDVNSDSAIVEAEEDRQPGVADRHPAPAASRAR